MLCQKCNKKQATTHVRQTVNGKFYEYDLCDECAASMGYKSIFHTIGINDLFSNLLGETLLPYQNSVKSRVCPRCGLSFDEFARTGQAGCAECYSTFRDELMPSLQRIHGRVQHVGKTASTASPEAKKRSTTAKLKKELNEAVKEQDFEKAALLRDQIAELEKED